MATGDDGLVKIAEYTGTTHPFAFSGLGSSEYAGLRLVASIQQSTSGLEYLWIRMNSLSHNKHQSLSGRANNGSISHTWQPTSGYYDVGAAQAYLFSLAPGTGNARMFTPFMIEWWGNINNAYSGWPNGKWLGYQSPGEASNNPVCSYGAYQYTYLSQITSIQIGHGGWASWSPGTIFSLYGWIKADDDELFSASD